jgi:hypothetical protein
LDRADAKLLDGSPPQRIAELEKAKEQAVLGLSLSKSASGFGKFCSGLRES